MAALSSLLSFTTDHFRTLWL